MGQRYEKNRKNVSENKETRRRISEESRTLAEKFSFMDELSEMIDSLDDDVATTVTDLREVKVTESDRLSSEREQADAERERITSEINSEIDKLDAGVEKLDQMQGFEFGGKALSNAERTYKAEIEKYKNLIDDLEESDSDSKIREEGIQSVSYEKTSNEFQNDSVNEDTSTAKRDFNGLFGNSTNPQLVSTVNEHLANGKIPDSVFRQEGDNPNPLGTRNDVGSRIEDYTKKGYNQLRDTSPMMSSQLLTEYNNRVVPSDNLQSMSRTVAMSDGRSFQVIDENLSHEHAKIRDLSTGAEMTVYPNPMGRTSHMQGQQGNNELGMHQDCGIASTAKGINDLYGKTVTSENRLADYAYRAGQCSLERNRDGSVDYYNSGGTVERNVRDFYQANGLFADAYTGNSIPTMDQLGQQISDGGVATLAVNHDLMWHWDEAQSFDPNSVDSFRYSNDVNYQHYVDKMMNIKDSHGVFQADHFINVSNAVYDNNGNLTHFIVSDTGNGTTKLIPKDYLGRACNGDGNRKVVAQGCVIATRRR